MKAKQSPSDPSDTAASPAGQSSASKASNEERSSFVLRIKDAWRDTVGAYATDDGETRNLFQRLVNFGEITGEESKKLVDDVKERIEENRREVDRRVDERIRYAVARVSIPSPGEIDRLNAKLSTIESRIQTIEGQRKRNQS